MTQYCRYCVYAHYGDVVYCDEKQITISDKKAKQTNKCKSFKLNEIDVFGENLQGYKPRIKTNDTFQIKLY